MVADVPDELRAKLQKTALDAYRALRVRDYGRIDMRLTRVGRGVRHRGQRQLLPGADAASSRRRPPRPASTTRR